MIHYQLLSRHPGIKKIRILIAIEVLAIATSKMGHLYQRLIVCLLAGLLLTNSSIAKMLSCDASIQVVPFQNVVVNPNCTLISAYSFGTYQEIFCYVSTAQSSCSMTWPYHGQRFSSALPLVLSIDPQFQGFFADPSGVITVLNNQTTPVFISCLFGY